jgi:type II restriction enzyme
MTLSFNIDLVSNYTSKPQRARILTEDWFGKNVFCPICGKDTLTQSPNNSRVCDFFCDVCNSDYELKSKEGALGTKITDGGYKTMISRIESLNNPHFFFLTHQNNFVDNLFFIPNYFFTPTIIEPRKPLSSTARREGWMGCKINIGGVPEKGKIFIILIDPQDGLQALCRNALPDA